MCVYMHKTNKTTQPHIQTDNNSNTTTTTNFAAKAVKLMMTMIQYHIIHYHII